MLNREDGFSLMEIMLTIVILAIVGTSLSSTFMRNAEFIEMSKNKAEALNSVQNHINEAILENDGTEETINLIFNEGESDQVDLSITGQLISETANYEITNGNTENITLQYFEVVVP